MSSSAVTAPPRAAFSVQALGAGLLTAFVGFASSFAVIIHGLTAVGATQAQAASALTALAIGMGLCGIWLSLRTRMPISVAWSTPGAALMATSAPLPGGFADAVGAFIATAVLIIGAGFWRPLGRWVAAIPTSLASAMLAGVLLGLCLAPVRAVAEVPALALPLVVLWAVVAQVRRLFAVPAAVLLAVGLIAATAHLPPGMAHALWPAPVLIPPGLSLPALVGITVPLFIVTMASQNIPGLAVLSLYGFRPDPGLTFRATGVASLLAAPFGAHAINLAAITAAISSGPDAHADSARRYWAAVVAGVGYVVLGLLAGAATAFISASPPILIEAVAGLALLGPGAAALHAAVALPSEREPAMVTFLVAASGLTILGIGAAFWGLLAGGALLALSRWRAGVAGPR